MSRARSDLVNALERHARQRPGQTALTFLGPDGLAAQVLSWGELNARALRFAAWLRGRPDADRPVLLLIRPEAASVVALCGCLHAGVACAPAPTPGRNGALARLSALATASGAALAVAHDDVDHLRQAAPGLAWSLVGEIEAAGGARHEAAAPDRAGPDTLALIQFTSGSTRAPKGVELTHANLVANLEMLRAAFQVDGDSRFASWLPLFHDMGLAMLLMPLYFGAPGVLMPPLAFIRRPARWLQMVQAHRATITGAPNFAFDLCLSRIGEEEAAALDLSSCRIAFCGAEPVRMATMLDFARRFAPGGLDPAALYPCYGLAEAVTFVSGGRLFDRSRAALDKAQRDAVPCGVGATGSTLAVVEAETRKPLAAGQVGEVWVAGPHVARGYHGLPDETAATFGAQLEGDARLFLRTGDLGWVDEAGRLTLVGRGKDVLIHRGANIHASDLEAVVAESHPGYAATGAAFAVPLPHGEGAVVVQEAARGAAPADLAEMRAAALEAVAAEHGLRLHALVLTRPGALPKTTSGKVRRQQARDLYLAGAITDLFDVSGPHREVALPQSYVAEVDGDA